MYRKIAAQIHVIVERLERQDRGKFEGNGMGC